MGCSAHRVRSLPGRLAGGSSQDRGPGERTDTPVDGARVADNLLGYYGRSFGSGNAAGHDPLCLPDADRDAVVKVGDAPPHPVGPLSSDCVANPVMQTVSSLPGGTSAPNTVITEYAMSKYHLQPSLNGWLIQAPAPLTATQIKAARHLALAYGVTVETKSDAPSLGEFADGATALGIVIAFGVLAASVGLIRSETARDLRTLTAAGAGAGTRRMITAATAAALGLLGAILGMAGAVIAVLAWAHSSLSAMFGDVPLTDVLILLIGLPLIAAAGGWLLAGREPEAIARQPLD